MPQSLIRITPQEGNALSILAGQKRGTTEAKGALSRLLAKGWLQGYEAKKIAMALVDVDYESVLSETETAMLKTYINWAERSRSYNIERMKGRTIKKYKSLTLNREVLLSKYLEEVEIIASSDENKTSFTPEEIVNIIATVIQQNPNIIVQNINDWQDSR